MIRATNLRRLSKNAYPMRNMQHGCFLALHDPNDSPQFATGRWTNPQGPGQIAKRSFSIDSPAQSSAATSFDFAVSSVQNILESIHLGTGLPWWATIAVSAVAVRSLGFPLVVYSSKAQTRFFSRGYKEYSDLVVASRRARLFVAPREYDKMLEISKLTRKGVSLIFRKHQCNPLQLIISPLIQVPTFFLFAFSTRDMINNSAVTNEDLSNELMMGGFGWFENLLEADPTYILPIAACSITYLNFELAFGKSNKAVMISLKNYLQYLPFLAFPFACNLPQGVFAYWISSGVYTTLQTLFLRSHSIRRKLGMVPSTTTMKDLPVSSKFLPK